MKLLGLLLAAAMEVCVIIITLAVCFWGLLFIWVFTMKTQTVVVLCAFFICCTVLLLFAPTIVLQGLGFGLLVLAFALFMFLTWG